MAKAIWNGKILAESGKYKIVDGNKYFPPDSINKEYFTNSQTKTESPGKGTSQFYHLKVHGQVNVDAAWCYPEPKDTAENIKGYVAFWRGVEIVE